MASATLSFKQVFQGAWARGQDALPWNLAYICTLLLPWMLIFNRAIADGCCVIIGALFLWHSYRTRHWGWLKESTIIVCLVAIAWGLVVVSPFAYDVKASYSIAFSWPRFPLMFVALRYWVLVRPEALRLLACSLAAMLGFVAVDTLWQYVYSISLTGHLRHIQDRRLTGPFDSVKVGIFTAKMLLPIIAIGLVSTRDLGKQYIGAFLAVFFLCIAIVGFSGERTAFCTLLLGIATMCLLLTTCKSQRLRALLMILVICGCIILMYNVSAWFRWRIIDFIIGIKYFDESAYGHLYKAGFAMAQSHPLIGVGFKAFRELCPQYMQDDPLVYCNLHPHNHYIEWLTEAGAIGMGIFIAFIASLVFEVVRNIRAQKQESNRFLPFMVCGVLVIHFFPFMGTQSFFSNWPALLLWYSLGLAYSSLNLLKKP